jgi:DNA-binding MarR family transcriptional regulator
MARKVTDSLEASGVVVLEPYPTDRRTTLVSLPRQGKPESRECSVVLKGWPTGYSQVWLRTT